jgi:hypothetical protein
MLATFEFILIYVRGVQHSGISVGAAVIPNISFVVGVILYIVLKYDPENPIVRPRRRSMGDVVRTGRGTRGATRPASPGGPVDDGRSAVSPPEFPNYFGDLR